MKYVEGFNRNQAVLFLQCIDDIIPPDAEVRVIEAFVESLLLKELGFHNHQPGDGMPSRKVSATNEGRPMYHPKDLLKLYIYGYLNRVRSSRHLEKECERNIELIWLLKGPTSRDNRTDYENLNFEDIYSGTDTDHESSRRVVSDVIGHYQYEQWHTLLPNCNYII